MVCKGIKSELNSTLFDCYVRNPTQKATPFSCDYLRNQIMSRLIMTYNAAIMKRFLMKIISQKIFLNETGIFIIK